jgi:septal ring factor EnvC (AmiA/AmiB activator)
MHALRFRPSPAGLLAIALGGVALFGWSAYGISASGKHGLEATLAQVTADRDALQGWRNQFKDVEAELRDVQGKVASTRDELAQVTATREKAKAQLAATQRDLAAVTKRLDQARDKAAQTTGSIPAAEAKKPAR